jgi:hypothetical protein
MFKPTARRASARPKRQPRRLEREARIKAANISVDGHDTLISCTIRDIHRAGARLSLTNGAGLPNEFLLICKAEDLLARVQIAWRNENEIGVKYLKVDRGGQEQQLREEQRAHYEASKAPVEAARVRHEWQAEPAAPTQPQIGAHPESKVTEELSEHLRRLGLRPNITYSTDDIQRAFRLEVMNSHTRRGASDADYLELCEAYRALMASGSDQKVS